MPCQFVDSVTELQPVYDNRKSFYGKAHVITLDNGTRILRSYSTDVCYVTASGEFVRTWGGYSVTTMRHVNDFVCQFVSRHNGGGAAWWRAQPVARCLSYYGNCDPANKVKARSNAFRAYWSGDETVSLAV